MIEKSKKGGKMEIFAFFVIALIIYLIVRNYQVDPDASNENFHRTQIFDDDDCYTSRAFWDPTCPLYDDDFYSSSSITSSSSSSSDDCDLSRSLWDPTCPLYHALHDDHTSSSSYDDWSSSSSSWDDWSSSTWDDDWSSSSSWDDWSSSSSSWDDD